MLLDDVTADESIRKNLAVYITILSAHLESNSAKLIRWYLLTKHAVERTQELLTAQKLDIVQSAS